MNSQSYQLVMRIGPAPGKVFALTAAEVVLGRDINNEIVINDAEISRRHTRLVMQENGYAVEDLGSTNGTFVNGTRIPGPQALEPGQTIRLGENVTFSYEIVGFDADATIASGSEQATPETPPVQPAASPPAQAQPAAPPPAQPSYASPAAPARQNLLAELTDNRNLMIGCGVALVLGLCVISALYLFTDCEFYANYFGFIFGTNCGP